jgi:hypothetical protein
MGLPKKGTRRIRVEGHDYRWAVSPDSGYMVLVIEQANDPGQRLEAVFRYGDVSTDPSGHVHGTGQRRRITPAVVRQAILAGLRGGWKPAERGRKPLRIADAEAVMPPIPNECV